ncbi:hypothetical protein H6795_02395 [Candidatus Nomurabacteria bacterium]|nr:hypothetical protein [Candidatus Nomurabacteria bacterium]
MSSPTINTTGGFTWVSQASVGGSGGVTALNGLGGALTIQGNSQIAVSASSPNINLSITADSIGDAQIANDSLTASSFSVGSSEIAAGAVNASELASTTVTSGSYSASMCYGR